MPPKALSLHWSQDSTENILSTKFPRHRVLRYNKGQLKLCLNDSMQSQQKTLHTVSSSLIITQWQAWLSDKANGMLCEGTKYLRGFIVYVQYKTTQFAKEAYKPLTRPQMAFCPMGFVLWLSKSTNVNPENEHYVCS